MRFISGQTQTLLDGRAVKIRDFIWFVVRDRSTGAEVRQGYWSDVGSVNAQVINPQTQLAEARGFDGAGTLISVSPIPLVSNLSVQSVTIELSQVSDADRLIRLYDVKQGRVEIYRGLFELGSMVQAQPAFSRFFGFIDEPEIKTPRENEEGGIILNCVSHSQELNRSNPATRSDAYQRQRSPSDSFRRHAAVVGSWDIKWGAAG